MVLNRCSVKNFYLFFSLTYFFISRSFLSSNQKTVGISIVMQSTNEGSHTSSPSNVRQKRRKVSLDPTNAISKYETPDGRVLYGTKREFRNAPLNTNNSLGLTGHIFKNIVNDHLPSGYFVMDHEPIWEPVRERRMELEVFCRWHGLRVPRTRSADLVIGPQANDASVLHRLQREVMQTERRLHRFHEIQAAKKHGIGKQFNVQHILADPMLISDPDLSDFTESSDDDFQRYIPHCLMHDGVPRCCMGYNW